VRWLVGWGLTALSAQKGYIMPECRAAGHSVAAETSLNNLCDGATQNILA